MGRDSVSGDMITPDASSKRKRVLLIGYFLSKRGGYQGVSEDLADSLKATGWEVITASAYSQRLRRSGHMVWTAWFRCRDYQIAHVDVFGGAAFLWAEMVCNVLRWLDKPYILTLHGGDLPEFAQRWPGRVRRLLRSAAAVTAPSRYLHEKMKPYRSDLHLLPNALHLGVYKFRLRQRPRPQLVWLRAFHGIYNPPLAPRVVALLAKDFPDVHLTMIGRDKGDGSLQAVRQTALNLGVIDRITVSGGVPKASVPHWMNRGDIFLNTTNIDNAPMSVLEAMACGLCVVSTDVGGIPYLLEHERDALLVPPDDPESMALAVKRLLTEPHLAEKLSRQAFDQVKKFDWPLVFAEWERLLTAVSEGRELSSDISA